MAVRKVSGRGRNMIGHFPSLKMRRMVAFESLIEQDFLYILDYEQDVITFAEQPVRIEYEWQGKILHYTPDFHVVRLGGRGLVECKPQSLVASEENQRKFKVAVEWCRKKDWSFEVVTDQALRAGHRLNNIKLLTRYARSSADPVVLRGILENLASKPFPITLLEAANLIQPDCPDQGVTMLLHLAFHHRIVLPLELSPISSDTIIEVVRK